VSGTTDGEMVYFGALSELTRRALRAYSDQHGFDEWLEERHWIDARWAAWLIALLKAEADDPELFPKGKWATIQRMEELLNESIAEYMKVRAVAGQAPAKEGK
jgi:hypothetical protein